LKFFYKAEEMQKLIIAIVFFLPFTLFAQINQTDVNGLRQGLWKKEQLNGKLLYEGNFKDGKPVGKWKRFHEGGQVKAIINYETGSDSAFAQLFDEWGKKVAEGNYVDEKKAGRWIYFTENRKVADENFVDGVKQGVSRKYYVTGELLETSDWKDGKQEGNYRVFFKNGGPFLECKMSDNKRNGLCLSYFQNNKVELEAHYRAGLRHGDWNYYDETGKLVYTLKYDSGKLLNPEVRDSLNTLELQYIDKSKGHFEDPEKYIEDPSEYMIKKNIYK